MEIVVWIVMQLALFGGLLWFVSARRDREMGVARRAAPKGETRELHELRAQRARALNMPLTELARPASMEDIVGQADGIRALRAALCGKNPQHVLLYGPPGVGKTCAARLVLEEAKRNPESPFDAESAFVEVDATCVRFDERAIADPLIGSVHDPIYQGAGALGAQGVPQPKPGAVTRAHCGVLFLDEIGELHPMQMNKLLKVLEDRRVYFDSAYYSPDNSAIPPHIHDIFQNGLPGRFSPDRRDDAQPGRDAARPSFPLRGTVFSPAGAGGACGNRGWGSKTAWNCNGRGSACSLRFLLCLRP